MRVYVGNADSLDIRVYALHPDSGALEHLQTMPLPDVSIPSRVSLPFTLSPDRRFLYTAVRSEPFTLKTFRIETDGRLNFVASSELPEGMVYLRTDATGRNLLCASYSGHRVCVCRVQDGGRVQPPHQIIEAGAAVHAVMTDPSNRYVLYSVTKSDRFLVRRFDAQDGWISDVVHDEAIRPESAPRHFAFHPAGRVYLLNEHDASIDCLDFDAASGALTHRHRASAVPPGHTGKVLSADIHVTPDGRFLYASERETNTIACFRCNVASGALEPLGSIPTESGPRALAVDAGGRFLLVAGQASNALTVYRINADSGHLDAAAQAAMGANPSWVEIL